MNKKIILSVLVCALVLGGSIGFLQLSAQDADTRMMNTIETSAGDIVEETIETVDPVQANDTEQTQQETPPSTTDKLVHDINGTLIIGAKDAPVTIMEYSSLSCPHCATFHNDTLGTLKKDYVDAGIVKFVFNNFPLNEPAMAASLLLQCIPLNDRYDFMELLFEQQGNWAFDSNYVQKLKQYAALLGVPSEQAQSCMDNTTKKQEILAGMSVAAQKFKIQSTPSFVIVPGEEMMMGAQPYGEFSKRIEAILKDKEGK